MRRKVTITLFIIPLLMLVATWNLLLQSTRVLRESAGWVVNLAETTRLIGSVEGDALLLRSGDAGIREKMDILHASLSRLESLVGEDPGQLARLGALRRSWRMAGEGTVDLDKMRQELADIGREHSAFTVNRMDAAEQASLRMERASAALFGLDLVVLGCTAFLLYRMRPVKTYVTACAWTKTILHEGEWISFEDYLQRRFGVSLSHSICPSALRDIERSTPEVPAGVAA